jgi:hypothetical protein
MKPDLWHDHPSAVGRPAGEMTPPATYYFRMRSQNGSGVTEEQVFMVGAGCTAPPGVYHVRVQAVGAGAGGVAAMR